MISKLLVNPGDTVLIEEYCYQGAMNRFRKLGAKLAGMKLDGDGIVIDALAQQLADLKAKGITPKFIYTIPTIQNPTASILPLDRRHALIRLAREYNVAIFEDECYADLLWDGIEAPPALYALDPGLRHPSRFVFEVARPCPAAWLHHRGLGHHEPAAAAEGRQRHRARWTRWSSPNISRATSTAISRI